MQYIHQICQSFNTSHYSPVNQQSVNNLLSSHPACQSFNYPFIAAQSIFHHLSSYQPIFKTIQFINQHMTFFTSVHPANNTCKYPIHHQSVDIIFWTIYSIHHDIFLSFIPLQPAYCLALSRHYSPQLLLSIEYQEINL